MERYNEGVSLLFLAACADWPRFSHPLADTGTPYAPGADVQVGSDFPWRERGPVTEPTDDAPAGAELEILAAGEGSLLRGKANGAGWNFDTDATRADCDGTPSGFPTEAHGDYAGDVDWRRIQLSEGGTLCSSFAYHADDARPDVLLFTLDACGNPADAVLDDAGLILGFAGDSSRLDWSATAPSATTVALVASAWAPDAPDRELTYGWGIALVEAGDDCPQVDTP